MIDYRWFKKEFKMRREKNLIYFSECAFNWLINIYLKKCAIITVIWAVAVDVNKRNLFALILKLFLHITKKNSRNNNFYVMISFFCFV